MDENFKDDFDTEKDTITIGFTYDGEEGHYDAKSHLDVYEGYGISTLNEIGRLFNTFLAQIGYVRPHSYIFMTSVDEEEIPQLEEYLKIMRGENI